MSVDEFRAQFAEAAGLPGDEPEAPAEEAETAETPAVEEPPDEPTPTSPDADTDEPVEAADEKVLLAGKYETTEQLEQAYAEMQTVLGRQGAELGDLRALRDEFQALREQITPQPQQADLSQIDEYFAENPHQIPALAQEAINNGDAGLYKRAMDAWIELDTVGAMDFHARAVSDANMAQLRAELAPLQQQLGQTQSANQFASAFEAQAALHEDFAQVMNAITAETIAGFPKTVIAALQQGDQASKQEVLETLYRWTKAEQAGNLTQAATAVARQTQEESRAARSEAAVATSSGSQDRERKTGVDAFRQAFRESDAFRKAAGQIP